MGRYNKSQICVAPIHVPGEECDEYKLDYEKLITVF